MKLGLLITIWIVSIIYCDNSAAQSVAINDDGTIAHPSAILDIKVSGPNKKGVLIPRITTTQRNAITSPAKGLLVYDSTLRNFYFHNGSAWTPIGGSSSGSWLLTGNAGTSPTTNFVGTIDAQPLHFRVNNLKFGQLHAVNGNISFGKNANTLNTSGYSNIAIGSDALKNNRHGQRLIAIGDSALFTYNFGVFDNLAIGSKSLYSNSTGNKNTAVGTRSLNKNTSGVMNTAFGNAALTANTNGYDNTAVGADALNTNTTGFWNTALGMSAMKGVTTGSENTAVGHQAFASKSGTANTAVGASALQVNGGGNYNTAVGAYALSVSATYGVFSANWNTAVGSSALSANAVGDENVAVGTNALVGNSGGNQNVGVGNHSLSQNIDGNELTAIGYRSNVSADGLTNATAIGAGAIVNASNKVRIGNTSVTVIEGQVPFTVPSDGRFKFNVRNDVKGLDFILKLNPVTYQFDIKKFERRISHSDVTHAVLNYSEQKAIRLRRTGFIAQEVEQAAKETGYNFSGIITPGNDREHYSLSYESFVVPLVKAVQEQQMLIDIQKEKMLLQQQKIELLEQELKSLSDKMEMILSQLEKNDK